MEVVVRRERVRKIEREGWGKRERERERATLRERQNSRE